MSIMKIREGSLKMAKALFVSNNEVLNALYSVNLNIYTGLEVKIVNSHEEAKSELDHDSSYDLILTLSKMEEEDTALLVWQYLIENDVKTPLVVVADESELEDENIEILKDFYDIKAVLQSVSKCLGITAKSMAKKEVPDFFPISIHLFLSINSVPSDVYYKDQSGEYVLILKKGTSVDSSIRKYMENGVNCLYVVSMERLKFVNLASHTVIEQLENEDLSVLDKQEVVSQGFEVVASNFFLSDEVSEEVVQISKSCVVNMQDVVNDIPQIKKLLSMLLENKSGYLYSHSILSIYVATHIINSMSWGTKEHIEKISFVFFFMDMYLAPIYLKYPDAKYEEDLLFEEELTDKEKDIILNHAYMASEAIKKFPDCAPGVDTIISQHHGMTNGVGFAINFKDDISPLAKVAIVAEAFVEDLLKEKGQSNNLENLSIDKLIEYLEDRFTKRSYHKLIDTLKTIRL